MSEGWDVLAAAVAEANALVAAAAPDAATAAEGEAYVSRVVASAMGQALLGHLLQEQGLARPLPAQGGPNPDYRMQHATIDPTRRYRLEGLLNGSERIGIGLYAPRPGAPPRMVAYTAIDRDRCAADDPFALAIAADATGPDALAIPPDARILLVRVLHRDPLAEPARLRLAGGDAARGLTLVGGNNGAALAHVARTALGNVRQYLAWTAAIAAHPNAIAPPPPELAEAVQGDPDTLYVLGGFDLAEGEWLELTMPAGGSGYWSVHAYNWWFEHLQTPGVGDHNAEPDRDGRIRIAVGPALPTDARNRVDTVGRRRGALICRIIGAGGCPTANIPQLQLRWPRLASKPRPG